MTAIYAFHGNMQRSKTLDATDSYVWRLDRCEMISSVPA